MDFRSEVMETIQSLPQWKDISADPVEFSDVLFRKNAQRCYEINVAMARELNRKPDIEALVAGAHYPHDNASCANYYVLARSRSSGEILLADAVINSDISGMREPYLGTIEEAKGFMKAFSGLKWNELWDLGHIVIHEPEVPRENRNSTRTRWGEIGKHFEFDAPQAALGAPLVLDVDKPFAPTGHTITLEEMNRYAASRPGMNTNLYGARFSHEDASSLPAAQTLDRQEERQHQPREAPPKTRSDRRDWRGLFARAEDSELSKKSAERS